MPASDQHSFSQLGCLSKQKDSLLLFGGNIDCLIIFFVLFCQAHHCGAFIHIACIRPLTVHSLTDSTSLCGDHKAIDSAVRLHAKHITKTVQLVVKLVRSTFMQTRL